MNITEGKEQEERKEGGRETGREGEGGRGKKKRKKKSSLDPVRALWTLN